MASKKKPVGSGVPEAAPAIITSKTPRTIVPVSSKMVVINDDNYHKFVEDPTVDKERKARGLIPRLFSECPQGYLGAICEPFSLPLIPDSEIEDRIRQQEKDKSSLQHIREQGKDGGLIPSTDQNGRGYCWAHGTCSAVMLVRAKNHQPFVSLSAYHVACIIKNYRDEGGWCTQALDFIAKRGIASEEFWPQRSVSKSNDTPQMWQNAALHKVEQWWDISDNRETAKRQMATLLLLNDPVQTDHNWWGHSICTMRLISWNPFKTMIWNSWGESWSDRGMGILEGSKAIPDGAVAPRVVTAATV